MTNENSRAVIFGVEGKSLSVAERGFFERMQPLGFILFSRNVEDPAQVQALVADLRSTLEHAQAPILIDQEGGRVARLKPPHWRLPPPAAIFGRLAEDDSKVTANTVRAAVRDNAWLIGCELKNLGISFNCAPCIDLNIPQAHQIIGDRTFGYSPDLVADLAFHAMQGFLEAGITPVLKHLPGHGRATADSHEAPAIVYTPREELMATDFRAFQSALEQTYRTFPQYSPWGMTAHVTYPEIDGDASATHSSKVIDGIIRSTIGFNGLLISDCITMKALGGSLGSRTRLALEAGCDVVLHCSGVLDEMIEVASQVKPLRKESWRRYEMSRTPTLPLRQDDEHAVLQKLADTLSHVQSNQ